MNKIFKVVWSKSKECYVVVSEVAKNNGGKKKVLASVLAGLAMVGVAAQMGTPVQAGANNGGNAVNLWADKKLDGSANTANTVGANSVAVGNNLVAGSASTTPTGRLGGTAIAIGVDSQAKDDRNIAIGYNNTTEGQDSVAMGSNVIAGTGQSIAIGSTNTAPDGTQTQTIARGKVTMKNGRPEPAAAIAIGAGAQAINGSGVLAMGQLAYASANNTVAIGTQTQAKADNSTAVGSTAQALSNSSAAFGTQAVANGLGATAVGPKAYAGDGSTRADGATAIGRASNASSKGSTSIGWANRSSAENATSIGFSATASGKQAVAIGGGDEYDPIKKDNSGAIISGTDLAKNYTTASGEHSVAIGSYAKATTNNSLAFGKNATANIENGVALGSDSVTTAAAGIAGYNPADSRTDKYSTQAGAIGTSTLAAVSVGNGTTATRQITGLAAGTADTDAVNVAQLKNVNLKYAGDTGNSDVLLKDHTLNINGDTDTFISTSADANGVKITAKVAKNITANADGKAVAPTTNGIATTDNVTQAINNSGWNANASANGGTLTGSATATKVVPGDTVTFSAGKNLTVEQTLGTNTQQYTYGLSSTLKDIQSIQNGTSKITLNNAGGTTISGGNLSVDGNKITKVAQGTDGTDAVNVDQLNAVAAKERHVKPGNYAVDGNGTVTLNYVDGNNADVADTAVISGIAKDDLSNITNAGKKVITGLSNKVVAGDNVTVTDTEDATTGQKTYKVSANVTKVTDGTNTTVTGNGTTADPYKVNVAGDLTGITSIANTAGGPTMTIGGNSINVTGGNLDLGGNKITDLAPGTDDTDAVNYKQLKAAKTVVAAGTNVTVAKTTGANGEDVYTVSASGGTGGAASTWNLKSGVASATEGTHSGDTTQNIADTKSVTLQAGKNLTVKQTNDGNGNTDVAYSLDSDLKDLTSVTTEKVTTKEIGLQDPTGKVTTIKNDGDRITYTKDGDTKVHKVATLDDEMHIKDTTYTVDGNKKVTMTYVDGNGNPVAGKTAVIDLSGLPVGETDTDMRIKEGTYTAQNGKVTLNTVDKGGNPVTGKDVVIDGINTNNYVAGDNVTLTPDTDAAGKPVVKINAALSTEKVVKKAGADNLATVSTASGNVAGDKGETYEVAVTKGDIENNAEISYKANGGTAQKTTLANGFNFTSDDNSVAITTGANGKVNFKVDTTGIQGKAFNLDVDKEGTGKVENAQTAATTKSVEKGTKFVAGNNLSIRRDAINGDANYDHQVTYALNSDLQGITSITNNGGATMNFGPNEVSITGGNLNMGDHKITNVKNGTDKSDVATVGQLTKVTSNDNTVAINKTTDADGAPVYDLSVQGGGHDPRVDQLGEEIGRVGAQGAALAALKPIQYDPLEPTQIMAGYGNYRGNSAIAMGVAHYKNESTLMHAGVSWAGGSRHMMANAGVTWKVGNRDSEAAVADRYRKGPISSAYAMQQEMASVKAQNAGLKTEVSDLKAENEQMKAQIAAMMAKLGM